MTDFAEQIERALAQAGLSSTDGAAVGVVRDGRPVVRHCRGDANRVLERPFRTDSGFRICSITKHFTCLLILMAEEEGLLSLDGSPNDALPVELPFHQDLRIIDLCKNRSGLRDYWCAAMLFGATAETRFNREDADRLLASCAKDADAPGTRYAYCNTNFLILGRILEHVYGRSLHELLRDRIFTVAGLSATYLGAETARPLPGWTAGYAPDQEGLARPAHTDIVWEGDAGIVSTLDDLLAWEKQFHDASAPLHRLLRRLTDTAESDDARTGYRLGMRVAARRGREEHLHTGGLRGWRSARLFLPEQRLSVVVLLNHMTEPASIARRVADAALGDDSDDPSAGAGSDAAPTGDPQILLDRETGLIARLTKGDAAASLSCGGRSFPALMKDGDAYRRTDDNGERIDLSRHGDAWRLALPDENDRRVFAPVIAPTGPAAAQRFAGAYAHGDGLGEVRIEERPDGLVILFEGFLGRSPALPLTLQEDDVATFSCTRALDHPPPGEFTCRRRSDGDAEQLTISCWHAHTIVFTRSSP
ncbi:MAG: serine hydrolase [Pseudomonadota bacterium]